MHGLRPNSGPETTAIAVESAIAYLSTAYRLLQDLVGIQCPHCARSMHTYTDGRPVSSHIRFGEGSQYTHTWHPDVASPHNRPREVGTLTTRGGYRKQIVIPAPGHLDAYSVTEPESP